MKKASFRKKEEKGQSVVEFALMLPIFLLIMMFSIEICFGVYYKMVLNHLLLNVARVVAVSKNETSSLTNSKIQAILDSYENHGALLFKTKDTSLFSISWTIQTLNVIFKIVTIEGSYTGVRLPFIGTLPITDQIVFPYVDNVMVLP